VTTSGDTQALPRIPVPGAALAEPLPTVALTLAFTAPEAIAGTAGTAGTVGTATPTAPEATPAAVPAPRAERAPVVAEPPAESHERIYEEAMATIAALASNWSSAVQRSTGRHRAAA
jgi:hypothetical protein